MLAGFGLFGGGDICGLVSFSSLAKCDLYAEEFSPFVLGVWDPRDILRQEPLEDLLFCFLLVFDIVKFKERYCNLLILQGISYILNKSLENRESALIHKAIDGKKITPYFSP